MNDEYLIINKNVVLVSYLKLVSIYSKRLQKVDFAVGSGLFPAL